MAAQLNSQSQPFLIALFNKHNNKIRALNSALSISGEWYLPGEDDKKYSGTLDYLPGEKLKLVIHGTFELFRRKGSYVPVIYGVTQKGPVTLINTFYTSEKWSNNIALSNYLPTFAYVGLHFHGPESFKFKDVLIQYHGLYSYLGLSGRKFKNLDNNTNWSLDYNVPQPISFEIDEVFTGQIIYEGLINSEQNVSSLEEKVYLKLEYQNEIDFNQFSDTLHNFRSFFSFLSNNICYPINILLNYTSQSSHVKLYYSNIFIGKHYGSNEQELVSFERIRPIISEIIKKWFFNFSRFNAAINIRTHSFYLANSFSDERFFDSVRAIESFHRCSRNNTIFELSEYNRLIVSVKKEISLDVKYHEWFNNRLAFGNEPPLKMRLVELLQEIPPSIVSLITDDIDWFARMVKNTRNYYTHKDDSLRTKTFTQSQQVKATRNIETLLSYFILKEIGVPEDSILTNIKDSLEVVEKST